MTRFSYLPVLGICLFAAACSGNDGEIKVDAAPTPLTEKGADALFTIELVDARSDGYAPDQIRVHVTPPDGRAEADVTCTVQDLNTNQKLDKGDKLACVEGAENKLDATIDGKESTVELFAMIDGKEQRVGSSTWTPPK